jgi:hypothetical protein
MRKTGTSQAAALRTRCSLRMVGWATRALIWSRRRPQPITKNAMGRQKPTTNMASSIPRNISSRNREKIAAYTASKLAKAIGNSLPGGKRVRITAITRQADNRMAKKSGEAMPATAAPTKDTNAKDNKALPRSCNQAEDLFFCGSLAMGRPDRTQALYVVAHTSSSGDWAGS